jgi:hypothetical protein
MQAAFDQGQGGLRELLGVHPRIDLSCRDAPACQIDEDISEPFNRLSARSDRSLWVSSASVAVLRIGQPP